MAASDGHQEVVNRYNAELLRTIRERGLPRESVAMPRTVRAADAAPREGDPTVVSNVEERSTLSLPEMRTP